MREIRIGYVTSCLKLMDATDIDNTDSYLRMQHNN